jgi:hypothetical protein
LILLADLAVVAVAFILTLLVGMASKVVEEPDFGSFLDYVTVAVWGFGVTELATGFANASWSEVKKVFKLS